MTIKLNNKEKDYMNLGVVVGDAQQPQPEELWEVSPTWNIVNWLRARNLSRKDFLTGRTLYFEGDDEIPEFDPKKRVIEAKLLANGIQPKYENDWKKKDNEAQSDLRN